MSSPRERAAHVGPERRRPQVLDAALAIAEAHGPGAVTMAAIAERLGVTRPVVYACYADRGEVLAALLQREETALLGSVLATLPDSPAFDDPKHLLIGGFQALLTGVAARPAAWRLLALSYRDPEVASRFDTARNAVAHRVGAVLEFTLRANGTPDLERKLPFLVEMFMSAGETAVRTLLEDATWKPDPLGEYVGNLLFQMLRRA